MEYALVVDLTLSATDGRILLSYLILKSRGHAITCLENVLLANVVCFILHYKLTTELMSDSNLEAFYAELDARMALPDDGNGCIVSGPLPKYCITSH